MGLPYLPPYSPDFNPIEHVFAKRKALLRRAAPRSFDALKHILKRFRPANCLTHSRYGQNISEFDSKNLANASRR